jgi:type I restriction-modification system DNA methylase subunit
MSATNFYAAITAVENILRNGVCKLTCDDAFEEISNLILLKLIEKDIDSNKINKKVNTDIEILLDEECKFSYIYDKYCVDYEKKIEEDKIKKGDLFKLLFDNERHLDKYYDEKIDAWIIKDNEKYDRLCVFKKLFHHKELTKTYQSSWKKYFKFEEKDEPDIVKSIIKINSAFNNDICTKDDIDLLGDAFEKYRDGVFGNKSGLGQYFTSQYIVQKILDEIKLTKDDKIFDPACGAGGFFIKAKNYIKEKHDKKEANKFAKNNMLGCEVDPRIFKILQLNAYLHGFKFENFELCDSVKLKDKHHVEEFDALVYNPPFGASIKTDKGTFPIDILNSVGLFLQLGFKALKKTGRCGVVVDQGILNNGSDKKTSWQGKIRQELLKNGLKKIIMLPEGAFQYTNFSICILIYDRNYKDKKIIYEEGYFKEEDRGTRIKPLHFKNIGEITYEQVEKNNYSLVYNDYFGKKNYTKLNGYIKIGDIGQLLPKSKHKAGDAIEDGKYNFYTSSSIIKKSNYNDFTEEIIIIGSGGNGSVFIDKNFSCSADNFLFQSKNMINKFIYYYLKLNFKDFYELYHGSGLKHLNQENFYKYKIPNINKEIQEEIIKYLDKYFEKNNIDEFVEYLGGFKIFQLLIKKNYDFFDNLQSYIKIIKNAEKRIDIKDWKAENKRKYSKLIKEGYDLIGAYYNKIPSEDINELFESKINLIIEKELIEKKKKMQIKGIFNCYLYQSKMVKLEKTLDFNKTGETISESERNYDGKDKIPYYGTGGITGYTNKYLFDGNYLTFSQDGSVGKMNYINGKFWCNHHIRVINFKNKYNIEYMHHVIKLYDFTSITKSNSIPNIPWGKLKNIILPIPPLDIQEKIVKQIEKLDEKTSHYNVYSEMIQKELDLLTETIKNICKMKEIVNDENNIEESDNETDVSDNEDVQTDNQSTISTKSNKSIKDTKDKNIDKKEVQETKSSKKTVKEESKVTDIDDETAKLEQELLEQELLEQKIPKIKKSKSDKSDKSDKTNKVILEEDVSETKSKSKSKSKNSKKK